MGANGLPPRSSVCRSLLHGFSQYRKTTSYATVTKYFAGPAQDSVHAYQSFVNSSHRVDLYIDSTKVDTSSFDPASYWGSQPWRSIYSEEVGHCQTDVPGLAVAKTHYTLEAILHNGVWQGPGSLNSPTPGCGSKFGKTIVSSTALDLWTAQP